MDWLNTIESPIVTVGTTLIDDGAGVLKTGINDISGIFTSNLLVPILIIGGGYVLLTQMNKR
jgi:hypothetical protein